MSKEKDDTRPDPDELLEKIKKETKGKLTVFLGAAAGVGKTYNMLEAAHDKKKEGINVIIGWVETHGRKETEKMLEGLDCISPRISKYREHELEEMDIDAILQQHPELVLVDELAHTNVPGSRHIRRFQDVEELVNAGINVYTTLNIQHIESLNDVIAQITGVIVRETVPDYIVEQASNIRLIDIPTEELTQRLQEGKVYIPGQAEQALKKFFRQGNINALRELALRFTANRVDLDMSQYMRSHRISGPWPAAGRVMVCVSASPFSAQLIRTARRLSSGLHADFLAVHVATSQYKFPISEKEQERLNSNMRLAEELGGKMLMVVGDDLVQEILDVARTHNVTSIVVGKPRHSRIWEILHGSLVDKLIRHSESINVYVIQGKIESESETKIKTAVADDGQVFKLHFIGGFAMTAAITAFSYLLQSQLELTNIALLYLIPVLLTAVWWGRWPSYFTAAVGVLSFDFLFVPPILAFSVYDIRYIWSFIIFIMVSFLIGGRTEMLRQEAKTAQQREKSVRALYEFSRQIAAVTNQSHIASELVNHSGETTGRQTVVFLPDMQGKLTMQMTYKPNNDFNWGNNISFPESEYAVAVWAYEHGQVAGCSTETLPGSKYLFVPLISGDKITGIFGIEIASRKITPEEKRLIDAWSGLAAVAFERVSLAKDARKMELLAESEKLRTILLNSISHELRTPLATITCAISTLLDTGVKYSNDIQHELLETVQEGASRMERVVTNLLDTARLESGFLKLKVDWCDLEDIIGTSLRRLGDATKKYNIQIQLPNKLPLFRADCVLLEQVFLNLFDNAMKYSFPGGSINIAAIIENTKIKIMIYDNGPGIPQEELSLIFDKFYRVKQQSSIFGTGLGLFICKNIIEAHTGEIWAENMANGGAKINIVLPLNSDNTQVPLKAGEKNE